MKEDKRTSHHSCLQLGTGGGTTAAAQKTTNTPLPLCPHGPVSHMLESHGGRPLHNASYEVRSQQLKRRTGSHLQ